MDVNRRFSGGLALRGVYTWSKTLDDGDSLNATAANNAVALLSNPYNPRADWGLATFDVRNAAAINVMYALPFGRGKRFLGRLNGVADGLVGGWTVNSIVGVQSGFPFTPQLSYNPANNGDSRNPVRPFLNPAFNGTGGAWESERVVQSQRFYCATEQQRFLRQCGAGYLHWARSRHVGLLGV